MVSKFEILTLKTHNFRAIKKNFKRRGALPHCTPRLVRYASLGADPPFQNPWDAHGTCAHLNNNAA